ncbi:MAG TPA: GxxExxY protein [Candidatus Thermoplasmatota archaeon]|nr:GxxExxY protein [Candidatus Thermoplasmatota archaeon]
MRQPFGLRLGDVDDELNRLAAQVVDAAFVVRRTLGPGLLEEIYRLAMVEELAERQLAPASRVPLHVMYKEKPLGKGYEADLIVAGRLVVELKAVEALHPVHEAQLLTYMRLAKAPLGFLINFNSVPFAGGIKRRVLSEFAGQAPTRG